MVGLKVSEGKQAAMTPSPNKKDKKFKKLKGIDSPLEGGKKASTPFKSSKSPGVKSQPTTPAKSPKASTPFKASNGTGAKSQTTPAKSPNKNAASKKKKKGKEFGKFGKRNEMKAKDDVFTKMVKEQGVKEHLSPMFLKKLDKCVARLPAAGKRFVYWLVHDVKYKIKFLPVIEEVFKLIKGMDVLPLPASGVPPKTKSQKRKARLLERRKAKQGAGGATTTPKKEKSEKRKIDEVGTTDDAVVAPDSQKKKKIKKEKPDAVAVKVEATSPEPDSSFTVNGSLSASGKKKKGKKEKLNLSSVEAENSFSAAKSSEKKKKKKSLGKVSDD